MCNKCFNNYTGFSFPEFQNFLNPQALQLMCVLPCLPRLQGIVDSARAGLDASIATVQAALLFEIIAVLLLIDQPCYHGRVQISSSLDNGTLHAIMLDMSANTILLSGDT